MRETVRENRADYKVCMDQRIFIINDHFLYEILTVFGHERQAGAVGILGGGSPEAADWGRLLLWDGNGENGIKELNVQFPGTEVEDEAGNSRIKEAETRGKGIDGLTCAAGQGTEGQGNGIAAAAGHAKGQNHRVTGCADTGIHIIDYLNSMCIITRCDTVDSTEIKEYGYKLAIPYQRSSWCLYDCREDGADGPGAEYWFWLLRVEMCHDLECAEKVKRMLTEGELTYKEHRKNVERQAFAKVITGYFWEDFLLGRKPDRYLLPDGAVAIKGEDVPDGTVGMDSDTVRESGRLRDKMHVVMAFNHSYVVYAAVMLQSLYENNPLCGICVHVLQCELSEMDRSLLQGQAQESGNEVLFYDCRREWLPQECMVTQEWSLEAYFRLFMTDVLPEEVDRVLYLDVDIIVNRPLYEFYFMDMRGYDLVACRDFSLVLKEGFEDKRKDLFARQEAGGDFVYFNSGVMLVDMGRLRGKVCGADYLRTVEELEGRLLAPDQDILNIKHWGHVGLVDEYRYDLFQGCLKDLTPEEVKQQVSIIHYAGPKPWRVADVNIHAHRMWWEYAGRVVFLQ